MENPLKDQQDKDSESNICRVKCSSFSPSSGARAGNKQLLPGALVDPRRCQCRGSWAGPELQEGPCGCPGSTEPCGAGQGHIRARPRLPGERAGPRRVPPASGARSREVAGGISSAFQPGATAGSARRGSARLCRLPLGDYRDAGTRRQEPGLLPAGAASSAEPCPGEGWRGQRPEGCAATWVGKVRPPRDVQGAVGALSPRPRLPGDGHAASGKQTYVCREECLLGQVQPRRYFWSQEAPREGCLPGIDCTRWTWHL